MVLAFLAGYIVGARDGSDALDEVIDAAKAVAASQEFEGTSSERYAPMPAVCSRRSGQDRPRLGRSDVHDHDPRASPGHRATRSYRERILR